MGEAQSERWSAMADDWSTLWGAVADPARMALVEATGITASTRVLDVGCGSGEFLRMLSGIGAVPSGIDPAPAMVSAARAIAPGADIRMGAAERLPWGDGVFDVAIAINALQLTDDIFEAMDECRRVVVPGGLIAVANWAEAALNDLDALEHAIALAAGDEPSPDGELRIAGGLESLFVEAGVELVSSGLVDVPWTVPDGDALVRGVMLGEDAEVIQNASTGLLAAAAPYRNAQGGYRLMNAFRFVAGRTPAS